jgi:outer membrane assembly lipoprotein YfiO
LYQQGNRIRAFYYFENLLDDYPESPLFVPALRKQYQIADRFLRGYRQRFLGLPLIEYEDEAVEMLYRIRQRAPGSQLAEQALLRTADYYFADAQYDLAADAYGWYTREHPRSPRTPRAKLRQAFSNYAQFRGLRFDATPLVDARAQLAEVIATYPELAEEERIAPVVERIDRTFAEKLFETADFYRRTGEPRAAVYTYRYLIAAYPNTPEAEKARRALEKAPKSALEAAPPGAPTPEPGATPVSALER